MTPSSSSARLRPSHGIKHLAKSASLALGLSVAVFYPSAWAVDRTWTSTSDPDFNTPGNWTSAPPGAADRAVFGTGSTVLAPNVSADTAINGLLFSAGGYTLSSSPGAQLTLGNGSSGTAISVTAAGTTTISSALVLGQGAGNTATFAFSLVTGITLDISGNISESGAATKLNLTTTQAGNTFILSGDNTYTGTTTVNQNVNLKINSATALGTGALVIATGTSTIDNTSGSAKTLTNNNAINLTTGDLVFTGSNDLSFGSGVLTMSGAGRSVVVNGNASTTLTIGSIDSEAVTPRVFTKSGVGILAITGAGGPNFTAGSILSAGTVLLGDKAALGTGTITNNGAILAASTDLSGANAIANAYTINSASSIGGSNSIEFAGLNAVTTSRTLVNNISTAGGAKLTLSNSAILIGTGANSTVTFAINGSGNTSISGNLLHNTGTLLSNIVYNGTGTLTLSGSGNTYSGTTTVNSGTLKIGLSNTIPTASTNGVTVASNVAGGTATFDLSGFDQTIATLSLGGATGADSTSTANVIGSGSKLTNTGGVIFTATGAPLGSTISVSTFDLNGATQTFNVADSASTTHDLTVSSIIQNGGIVKNGSGTLLLNGINTYAGGTAINQVSSSGGATSGTLALGNNRALGAGPLTVGGANTNSVSIRSSDATDRAFTTDETTATDFNFSHTAGTGTVNLGSATTGNLTFGFLTTSGGGTKVLSINNAQTKFASWVATIGMTTAGTGALIVPGTWTGSGGLVIGNSNIVAFGSGVPTVANQGIISVNNGGVLGTNGTLTRTLGTTANTRFLFSGSGGFAGYGNNAAFGNAANNLVVQLNNGTSTLTFGSTSSFLASGQALVLGNALATGTVDFQNGLNASTAIQTIRVDRSSLAGVSDVDATISGALGNAAGGGFTKTGAGTLVLSATSSSYTGPTAVTAGAVLVSGSITGSTVTVGNGTNISAILGGAGTVGAVSAVGSGDASTSGARVNPGNTIGGGASSGTGTLITGNFALTSGAHLDIQIGATTSGGAGTLADKVNVVGSVDLTNADLTISLFNNPVIAADTLYTIIANDGTGDGVTGVFSTLNGLVLAGGQSLGQGGHFFIGSQEFAISYRAEGLTFDAGVGLGNDVALMAVPEPGSVTSLFAGLGLLLGLQRFRARRSSALAAW